MNAEVNLFPPASDTAGDLKSHTVILRQLVEQLAFSDAAARESHHRVKNTLQMAIALLSMQARNTPDAEVKATLKVASGRLSALSTVHELLYREPEDSQTIRVQPLLNMLAESLKDGFTGDAGSRIQLKVSAEDLVLTADQAIPLALIANEAISNAYKHGFPASASGFVTVSLIGEAEGLVLRIADNGKGISPIGRRDALGLTLMGTFTDQLKGIITFTPLSGDTGTVMRLWVPVQGMKAHAGPNGAVEREATAPSTHRESAKSTPIRAISRPEGVPSRSAG